MIIVSAHSNDRHMGREKLSKLSLALGHMPSCQAIPLESLRSCLPDTTKCDLTLHPYVLNVMG